jgi:hypothetical protein
MTRKDLHPAFAVRFWALSAVMGMAALALVPFSLRAQTLATETFQRDPKQAIDESYTQLIRKYTTALALNSPLTDYLPASSPVPTSEVVKLVPSVHTGSPNAENSAGDCMGGRMNV